MIVRSTPLGLFDHLAGALAFLLALALGPRGIGALLSIVSSASLGQGRFVTLGPVSWQWAAPNWGLLLVLLLVGGTALALDRVLSKGVHRFLVPPLVVGASVAALALVVPPMDGGSTPVVSGLAFGMAASVMFSVWWFTALGVSRLRRSASPIGRT